MQTVATPHPIAMPPMMACEKMHARIPVATCVARQQKGIKIGRGADNVGPYIPYECRDCEAGRAALAGNPPEIKKEEIMGVAKPCKNCGRTLQIVGEDCCYVCYHAGKGEVGQRKDAARAAIKAKIENGDLRKAAHGPRKKTAAVPGQTAQAKAPVAPEGNRRGRPLPEIVIVFAGEHDVQLHDILVTEAQRLRRTVENQILWMLQNAIEEMTLKKETAA